MVDKKVERVVAHPKLHLAVKGRLQHVKPGTKITVTESQAKRLGKKLADPTNTETVDVGADVEAEAKAAADAHAAAVATAKKK